MCLFARDRVPQKSMVVGSIRWRAPPWAPPPRSYVLCVVWACGRWQHWSVQRQPEMPPSLTVLMGRVWGCDARGRQAPFRCLALSVQCMHWTTEPNSGSEKLASDPPCPDTHLPIDRSNTKLLSSCSSSRQFHSFLVDSSAIHFQNHRLHHAVASLQWSALD